eukprot:TRINITY_DN15408_c0_g1_i2.p2 TRINITY_DN15408_c0_g1~~TRINITY_DN15408_c0_g1_i2.p2  ORF type:complete len:216 (+),score=23.58 TRINITY_DN15408_c0_g1_i2:933-1580(+)
MMRFFPGHNDWARVGAVLDWVAVWEGAPRPAHFPVDVAELLRPVSESVDLGGASRKLGSPVQQPVTLPTSFSQSPLDDGAWRRSKPACAPDRVQIAAASLPVLASVLLASAVLQMHLLRISEQTSSDLSDVTLSVVLAVLGVSAVLCVAALGPLTFKAPVDGLLVDCRRLCFSSACLQAVACSVWLGETHLVPCVVTGSALVCTAAWWGYVAVAE